MNTFKKFFGILVVFIMIISLMANFSFAVEEVLNEIENEVFVNEVSENVILENLVQNDIETDVENDVEIVDNVIDDLEIESDEEEEFETESVLEIDVVQNDVRLDAKTMSVGSVNIKTSQVESGSYLIKSYLNDNVVLNVNNNSNANCANINVWRNRELQYQLFEFVYNSERDAYVIKIKGSGKVLDVAHGGTSNGTNVWQYEGNGTVAQDWILEDAGNGYFYIVSKANGLYLDIAGGNVQNGSNVQLYQGNKSGAQKFKLEKSSGLESSEVIISGKYYIVSGLSGGKVICTENGNEINGTNVSLFDKTNKKYQVFSLEYVQNLKAYIIRIDFSDRVLDVQGGGTTNGTNVWQYTYNGSLAQQWILKDAGNGCYYIVSKANGLYLDIAGGSLKNYANVQLYEGNSSNAQKYRFVSVIENVEYEDFDEGIYKISSLIKENKNLKNISESFFIDEGASYLDKKELFEIKKNSNGYYYIKSLYSNKYLTADNSQKNGVSVVFENRWNSTRQDWSFIKSGDGFVIVSRSNDLVIDIPSGNVNSRNRLHMYEKNDSQAQCFNIELFDGDVSERVIEDGVYSIASAKVGHIVLDINGASMDNCANVQIWSNGNAPQHKFVVEYNEDEKYYEIYSVNSGKALDVAYGGTSNGSNVWQYERNGSDAQKWILKDAGNGEFYIISKKSLLNLDINGGKVSNGTNIQLYEGNGSVAQRFKFVKNKIINEDTYNLILRSNGNMQIDISAGSIEDNAKVQIWEKASVNQQAFDLKVVDDNYYKFVAKNSNKLLSVVDGVVVQLADNGEDNQLWSIEVVENGFYRIKSKSTGLYMSIENNKISNGSAIVVTDEVLNLNQCFKFKKIETFRGIDISEFNGNIDWVKLRQSGMVDFAIIRAGYRGYRTGKIVTDKLFATNVQNATNYGLDIGLYFFTQAVTVEEAVEEANYVLDLVRQYNLNVKYPIFIDTEASSADLNDGRADNLDNVTRTLVCNAFVDTIQSAGYVGGIYASRNWVYNRMEESMMDRGDIWIAHYTAASKTDYKYRYDMWQYTSSGSVDGINGRVDLNISYKTY